MERDLLAAAVQRAVPHPLGLLLFDDAHPWSTWRCARSATTIPIRGWRSRSAPRSTTAIERQTLAEEPFARDPEVREMLIDARIARQATVDTVHCIAGVADGRHVGNTIVYAVGDVGQVEDVATLQAFRRRGVARAMVSLAIDLAGDGDLIWIAADDNDWPKDLYSKLGFRPMGRIVTFTRVGPEHPASDPAVR